MKTKEEIRNEFFDTAKRKLSETRFIVEVFLIMIPLFTFFSALLFRSEIILKHGLPFILNYFPFLLFLVIFIFLSLKQKTIIKISDKKIKNRANEMFFAKKEELVSYLKEISRERIELDNEEKEITEELKVLEEIEDEFRAC